MKVLLVYTQRPFEFITGGNVFNCESHVISIHDLCNGKVDCQNDKKLDEMYCDCKETQVYSSKCKHLTSVKGQKHCSDFYIKVKNNECWPVTAISCMTGTKEQKDFCYWLKRDSSRSKVSWNPTINISPAYFKDKSFRNCEHQGFLPCTGQQISCYKISEICSYILDDRKYLLYCKGGEHLQYCKDFECNMKFKCPGYYCIPWAYVCDGKFDCPNGLEEQNCKMERYCKNMFKYKNSQICIHLNDICDGKVDCPYDEDELTCILHDTRCPSNCECLMFTIRCFNLRTVDLFLKIENSYDVIIISNSTKDVINSFLPNSRFLSILKLSRNNLDELCEILPPLNRSLLIDAGFNEIYRLKYKCFVQAVYLKIIILNNNQISTINKGAFNRLNELFTLDLSCNLLTTFSTFTYEYVSNLHLLKLNNNNIRFVSYKSFHKMSIHFIETNVHSLTCIPNLHAKFLSIIPWFLSCSNFLLNNRTNIFSFCAFSIISIFNIILMVENLYFCKIQTTQSVFTVNALSLNVIDTLHGLYIFYLFSVDLYYGETFGFHQIQWRSSHVCFLGFSIALYLTLLSLILSCFVALGRLMIVCFPMDTKFKTKTFVIKCIFTFTIITIFVVASITIAMQSIYKQVPFGFCTPFVDPTKSILLLKLISWFVICYQFFAVFFILVVYILTFILIQKSREAVAKQLHNKQPNLSLLIKLITISISCFICWVPSSTVYLATWILEKYPIDIIIWTAIAITPFNSIMNPLISLIGTARRVLKGWSVSDNPHA